MENNILKIIYTFFLGLLLALFVGLGISTFYIAPTAPEYTYSTSSDKPQTDPAYRTYNEQSKRYEEDKITYNRNVSMIALASAVMLLIISFGLEKRNKIIANGVLLGGLFTLLYSIGRGFASQDSKYTFIVVSIGLAIVLYLGYRRFSDHPEKKKGKE